jgi:hypothetical protein
MKPKAVESYPRFTILCVTERVRTDAIDERSNDGFLARGTAKGSENLRPSWLSPLPWCACAW